MVTGGTVRVGGLRAGGGGQLLHIFRSERDLDKVEYILFFFSRNVWTSDVSCVVVNAPL